MRTYKEILESRFARSRASSGGNINVIGSVNNATGDLGKAFSSLDDIVKGKVFNPEFLSDKEMKDVKKIHEILDKAFRQLVIISDDVSDRSRKSSKLK